MSKERDEFLARVEKERAEFPPMPTTRELMRDPGRCKNAATWLIWPTSDWDEPDPRSWACDEHYVDVCKVGEKVTGTRPLPLRCKYRFKRGNRRRR